MGAIANLAVSVTANTRGLSKGLRRGRRSLADFGKGVRRIAAGMGALFAGGARVVGFTALVKNSLQSADALAKTSDKLGLATEKLAGLQHAAELTGAGTRTLDMGLQRMTRRVSEAAQGTGEAQGALRELGLDARKLAKLPVDQQFGEIAEAMEEVKNQSDRVRLGFKLFDSEGVALINTLKGGKKALADYQQEARRLGLTMSRSDAFSIEMVNDSVTGLRAAFKGLGNELAVQLAPLITALSRGFTDLIAAGGGIRETVVSGFELLIETMVTLEGAHRTAKTSAAEYAATVHLISATALQAQADVQRALGRTGAAGAFDELAAAAKRASGLMTRVYLEMREADLKNNLRVRIAEMRKEAEEAARQIRHQTGLSRIASQIKSGSVGVAAKGTLEAYQAERRGLENLKRLHELTRENLRYNRQTAQATQRMAAQAAAQNRGSGDTFTDAQL
jgi:molybdopterin synthase catalytic subunit